MVVKQHYGKRGSTIVVAIGVEDYTIILSAEYIKSSKKYTKSLNDILKFIIYYSNIF
jgi:hypothetical protein